MESVSGLHVQMEDSEGSQLCPACMLIPLILRKILEHCSTSELLQLSLVNKQWNNEARSVIKDRGTVVARLDRQQPCKDFAVFVYHVRHMKIVPYSGLCIDLDLYNGRFPYNFEFWTNALKTSLDVFRKKLPLKHLTVSSSPLLEREQYPTFLWMQEILQDNCWVLESLTVRLISGFEKFNRQDVRHFDFPRLKKLKVLNFCSWPIQTSFIKTMVSRSPNLEEVALDSPVTADDYRALLEGSSAVIVVDEKVDLLSKTLRLNVIPTLRLRKMGLSDTLTSTTHRFDVNGAVPVVLQTSRTTLQELSLSFVFAPCLMRYGIRLENVTRLELWMVGQLELYDPHQEAADVSALLRTLQDLDFTHIFPKLIEVEVWSDPLRTSYIREFLDQGNVNPQEPSPNGASNIKHLKYLAHRRTSMNVPFIASVFRDIEALSIEDCTAAPPFGLICQHWVHLKQLVIRTQLVERQNWDSLLCGLFPEEIAHLREQDEEYLKAVNIVPVMPAITCMKELRTLTVSVNANILGPGENDPTFVFSEVTGLIAFSRCPKLSVTLQVSSNCENAWRHMKHYANIVLVDSPKMSTAKRFCCWGRGLNLN